MIELWVCIISTQANRFVKSNKGFFVSFQSGQCLAFPMKLIWVCIFAQLNTVLVGSKSFPKSFQCQQCFAFIFMIKGNLRVKDDSLLIGGNSFLELFELEQDFAFFMVEAFVQRLIRIKPDSCLVFVKSQHITFELHQDITSLNMISSGVLRIDFDQLLINLKRLWIATKFQQQLNLVFVCAPLAGIDANR